MKKLSLLIILLMINLMSFAGVLSDYRSAKRDANTISEISGHAGGILVIALAVIILLIPLIIWAKINAKKQAKIAEELAKKTKEDIDNYLIEIKEKFKSEELNITNWSEVESLAHNRGLDWIVSKGNEAIREGKRAKELIAKYGEDKGKKIYGKQFYLGMTKEELRDSTGEPSKVETEVLKTKTKEVWIYGNKSSGDVFIFENEILTKFKDR